LFLQPSVQFTLGMGNKIQIYVLAGTVKQIRVQRLKQWVGLALAL
jgi:hypothetical protein